MSAAAEQFVTALTHAQVTEVARALLMAIARLIPEGETTTPLIGMGALAASARIHRRTVCEWMPILVAISIVRVVDGGRGRPARYTLVGLSGMAPIEAVPLPLVGVAKPRRKVPVASAPTLFDPPVARSESEEPVIRRITWITWITGWAVTGWRSTCATCDRFIRETITCCTWITRTARFVRSESEEPVIGTCDPVLPLGVPIPLDVGATTKNVRTKADQKEEEGAHGVLEFLTWWMATFPQFNGGAVYSLDRTRDEPIVRALLHGRSVDLLQAMAVLLWTITSDGVHGSSRWWIAEECTDRGLFALRHKANYLAQEVSRRAQEAAEVENVWALVLRRLESPVGRYAFHTYFRELTLFEDRGTVIVVTKVGENGGLVWNWIQKHHRDAVRAAVDAVRPGARVEFVADEAQARKFG